MAIKRQFKIDKFRGGVVSGVSNSAIGPIQTNPLEEFPIIDNYQNDKKGALETRVGFTNKLIYNDELLNSGLIQSDLTDNDFDELKYEGSFDAYFKFEAKGFYEQGDGSYEQPEPQDTAYDIRLAVINGYLIVVNLDLSIYTSDSKYTIFPTRVVGGGLTPGVNMESVQFGEELYLATGDGYYILRLIRRYNAGAWDQYELELRRMDSVDEIYYPDSYEYQVVGQNLLFPDGVPDIVDVINTAPLKILGVRTKDTRGTVGKPFITRAYIQNVLDDTIDNLFYQLKITDPDGTVVLDYRNGAAEPFYPSYEFTPTKVGTYRIYWGVGTSHLPSGSYGEEYEINYEVFSTDDNVSITSINAEINACNRILLYYNRIILYGNGSGKWYKSDINRPGYFTIFGIDNFASINDESSVEVLQSVTPFRNTLITLTKKSIFLTYGKGDDFADYAGNYEPFNTIKVASQGTLAPYSVATNDNNLIFLGTDGIYLIDTQLNEDYKVDLYKISENINPLVIGNDNLACAVVFNNKYYINFPSVKYSLRWDYEYARRVEGVSRPSSGWTRDVSTELEFKRILVIDNDMYAIKKGTDELTIVYNREAYDAELDLPHLDSQVDELKTGTGAINSGSDQVVGTGTLFTTEFEVGDYIVVGSLTKIIKSIEDDTHLTTTSNFSATTASASIYLGYVRTEKYEKFVVTVAGLFFNVQVKVGDVLQALVANASTIEDWLIIENTYENGNSKLFRLNSKHNNTYYETLNDTDEYSNEQATQLQLLDNRDSFIAYDLADGATVENENLVLTYPVERAITNGVTLLPSTQYTLLVQIDEYSSQRLGTYFGLDAVSNPFETGSVEQIANYVVDTIPIGSIEKGTYSGIRKILLTTKSSLTNPYTLNFKTFWFNGDETLKFRATLFEGDLTDSDDDLADVFIKTYEFGSYANYLYKGYLTYKPIVAGSLKLILKDISIDYEAIDDGNEAFIVADGVIYGTINYNTGKYAILLNSELTEPIRSNYKFDHTFEEYIYPLNYFTDDTLKYEKILESKGYGFEDNSMLKKVKQINLEVSNGAFTLLYSTTDNDIIDAKVEPEIIFDPIFGRVVSYSNDLSNNLVVFDNFNNEEDTLGILGESLLGNSNEHYRYVKLDISAFSQTHKIVLINKEDRYVKILGYTFVYILGKNPRS